MPALPLLDARGLKKAMGLFSVGRYRFDEWLSATAPLESTHPQFDCRRARPEEFDAIYDLVDESFVAARPRPLYDWLYRRNPYGLARCWVVVDRASGRLIGSTASWPWPMARGTEAIDGVLAGDWVIAPQWQRRGIAGLRADVRRSHAWQDSLPALSWPNEKSRGSGRKRGRDVHILGPTPRAVLLLRTRDILAARRWPAVLSAVGGGVGDGAVALWRAAALGTRTRLTVEAVRRFDSSFDAVTERCMAWSRFWSPHGADFLNWRYFERPAAEYLAYAATDRDTIAGYYVLKVETAGAWLMEFVAPVQPREVAVTLLLHAIRTAREAGCVLVRFSASSQWRHWPLFRRAGFLPTRSEIYLWPGGPDEANNLDAWQWTPGDMDDL